MKSSAEVAASCASKFMTMAPSSPLAANRRSLSRALESWNSVSCGRKKSRGCGEKVSAAALRPSALARLSAAPITARWPRCTPSKLPIATTAPYSGPIVECRAVRAAARQLWKSLDLLIFCVSSHRAAFRAGTVSARLINFQINRIFNATGYLAPLPGNPCGHTAMAVDTTTPILIVDDYNTMIRIIRNLLRQLGFEHIDDANDGSAALAKMRERHYGLVISDWNMEPMTGYDLLQEVRSDPGLAETPFIMVTAESKTENVIAAKKAGVSNYIVKPFNAQTLKTKIDAVFGDDDLAARLNLNLHHFSSRITAFGISPAAAKVALSALRSGRSRPPSSSAWMPEVTNRKSTPMARAPLRSVRTESPTASTRRAGTFRPTAASALASAMS